MHLLQPKYIWQDISPAPFESGWMIFAKLMLLNRLKPQGVVEQICAQEHKENKKLNFRNGDWINFDSFSEMLEIQSDRLKFCFLDQLQIYFKSSYEITINNGIKFCSECLALGYHCVFFELSFINICPWHLKKLEEPCIHCLKAVHNQGLKFQDTNKHRSQDSLGLIKSDCRHIFFEIDNITSINHLSIADINAIKYKCNLLYGWIKIVQLRLDLSCQLFTTATNQEVNENLINAAVQIAGSCPWPIENYKRPVKWSQLKKQDSLISNFSINTIYRSLRKHIFNRYVKPHRTCYESITMLKRDQSLSMSSDHVCAIALAYIVWRMKIENLINIEAFNINLPENHRKSKFEFFHSSLPITARTQAQMMYGHFCWILDYLMRNIEESTLIITNSSFTPHVARSIINYDHKSTIIYADPEHLEKKSWVQCACKNLKNHPEITSKKIIRMWAYENYRDMMSTHPGIMFRLIKLQKAPNKQNIKYLNI